MNITLPNYKGGVLKTAGKYHSEDITITSGLTKYAGEYDINWLIEQYKVAAGATVNAGDFVEFVNAVKWGNGYNVPGETGASDTSNMKSPSAFELSNNRVLLVYRSYSYTCYPTAVILTLSGGSISGTSKIIKNIETRDGFDVVELEKGKFLISYVYYNSSADECPVEALVFTVSESGDITAGTSTIFETNTDTYFISLAKLNEGAVVVSYMTSNNYGTSRVLSISGTTITAGTAKVFNSAKTTYLSSIALNESKVLVVYPDGGNSNHGTAIVLSISGTTITAGTAKVFNSASTVIPETALINESKVLVVYPDGGNSNHGTAIVLSISGTTITAGTKKVFDSKASTCLGVTALNESKFLVIYKQTGTYYETATGTAVILSVSGTTITAGTPTEFEPNAIAGVYFAAVVAFSESSALVIYDLYMRTNPRRYQGLTIDGMTITLNTESESETTVKSIESGSADTPIAKTSGTSGETIDVYVFSV